MTQHVLYLHGFGSSPQSRKAQYFKPHFEAYGVNYHIPDLNEPSFEKLLLTGMLDKVAETIQNLPEGDVYLIGSSMGGLTATHFLDRYPEAERVKKAVMIAPAFDFIANRTAEGIAMFEQWKQDGERKFFNYAKGGERPVHYGLVEDVAQYESYGVQIDIPILIYHGRNDTSVDVNQSVKFAESRENAQLEILESDHEMLDKKDEILQGILRFFEFVEDA